MIWLVTFVRQSRHAIHAWNNAMDYLYVRYLTLDQFVDYAPSSKPRVATLKVGLQDLCTVFNIIIDIDRDVEGSWIAVIKIILSQ